MAGRAIFQFAEAAEMHCTNAWSYVFLAISRSIIRAILRCERGVGDEQDVFGVLLGGLREKLNEPVMTVSSAMITLLCMKSCGVSGW